MANTIKKAIQEGLEVKYVTKSTVLGEGWGVVITTKDGEEFSPFYPFGTFEGVREFTRSNLDLLLDKMSSDDNHGLAFYACGYNGDSQQKWCDHWRDRGVSVFWNLKSCKIKTIPGLGVVFFNNLFTIIITNKKNAVKTAKKEGNLYENIKHFFKK